MGTLYIVSTPIGNMEDITLRAIRVLGKIDFIACEDTRKTGLLLQRLKIPKKQLISFFGENEASRLASIIQIIKEGKDVALVSNSGTPLISDPGYKLVKECVAQGIKVIPIPGASALLAGLVVSGLPTDKFLFLGFLPKKSGKREKVLKSLPVKTTIIFYESPFRLVKTLTEMKDIFGDIQIVICRELTKVFEEIRREKVSEAVAHFEKVKPRGEFTILFHLSDPGSEEAEKH